MIGTVIYHLIPPPPTHHILIHTKIMCPNTKRSVPLLNTPQLPVSPLPSGGWERPVNDPWDSNLIAGFC